MNANKYILPLLTLFYAFSAKPVFPQEEPQTIKKEDRAKLVLLQFVNETKTKDYEYLSVSIEEAVAKRMQESFIYERPKQEDMQSFGERKLLTPITLFMEISSRKNLKIKKEINY